MNSPEAVTRLAALESEGTVASKARAHTEAVNILLLTVTDSVRRAYHEAVERIDASAS